MKWEKFLGTSQTSKMALHSLTFMVDPTMNLISRPTMNMEGECHSLYFEST